MAKLHDIRSILAGSDKAKTTFTFQTATGEAKSKVEGIAKDSSFKSFLEHISDRECPTTLPETDNEGNVTKRTSAGNPIGKMLIPAIVGMDSQGEQLKLAAQETEPVAEGEPKTDEPAKPKRGRK